MTLTRSIYFFLDFLKYIFLMESIGCPYAACDGICIGGAVSEDNRPVYAEKRRPSVFSPVDFLLEGFKYSPDEQQADEMRWVFFYVCLDKVVYGESQALCEF